MRKQMLIPALLLFSLASLAGCSKGGADQASSSAVQAASKPGREATMAQQIRDIDNNPNMPAEAKAAAKANIQQHQGMDLSAGRK